MQRVAFTYVQTLKARLKSSDECATCVQVWNTEPKQSRTGFYLFLRYSFADGWPNLNIITKYLFKPSPTCWILAGTIGSRPSIRSTLPKVSHCNVLMPLKRDLPQ